MDVQLAGGGMRIRVRATETEIKSLSTSCEVRSLPDLIWFSPANSAERAGPASALDRKGQGRRLHVGQRDRAAEVRRRVGGPAGETKSRAAALLGMAFGS